MHCRVMSYSPATIGTPRFWLSANMVWPNWVWNGVVWERPALWVLVIVPLKLFGPATSTL